MTDIRQATVDLSRRDLTLDLTRVFCVLLVVVIHLLMIGVGVSRDGAVEASRPLEAQPWFDHATWIGQVMPVFFVVGGFAGITSWRSTLRRGGTAAEFIRTRVLRLAQPALPVYAFFTLTIAVVTAIGVPAELIDTVFTGAGSPLWFLAAYTLCQAFVPVMARLHLKAPRTTMVALLVGAVAVDTIRYSSGAEIVGYLNFAFVWLFIQQVGFWYADGWFDRSRTQLVAIASCAFAALIPLTVVGPYSTDMLTNLNPPTLPLMALGIAQACALRLLKPVLAKVMETKPARAVVFVAGTRLMTVYLWHLPVVIALAGLTLLIPGAAVAPASAEWWLTRPIYFLVTLLAVFGLSFLVGRFETLREGRRESDLTTALVAAGLAFIPSFVVTVWFLSLGTALLGTVLVGLAVAMLNRPEQQKKTTRTGESSRGLPYTPRDLNPEPTD
ncbi:MAG: acyltransferase [Naasia sp.]